MGGDLGGGTSGSADLHTTSGHTEIGHIVVTTDRVELLVLVLKGVLMVVGGQESCGRRWEGQCCVYRIVTEGEVTMANSNRGRQPKVSIVRSGRPVVSI